MLLPLARDGEQRLRIERTPGVRGIEQQVVALVRFEAADREQQRPVHRAQIGPFLAPHPVMILRLGRGVGGAGAGDRDRRQPGVPRTPLARPVHQGRAGPQDDGGRPGHPPFHQMHEPGPRALGVRLGVPGDDQRNVRAPGAAQPAQRHRCPHPGPQSVRMHQVGVPAGAAQQGHPGRFHTRADLPEPCARAGEVIGPLGVRGGADGDPYAARHQAGGQRADVCGAAGAAVAEHLDRAQRRLAVRRRAGAGHEVGAPGSGTVGTVPVVRSEYYKALRHAAGRPHDVPRPGGQGERARCRAPRPGCQPRGTGSARSGRPGGGIPRPRAPRDHPHGR